MSAFSFMLLLRDGANCSICTWAFTYVLSASGSRGHGPWASWGQPSRAKFAAGSSFFDPNGIRQPVFCALQGTTFRNNHTPERVPPVRMFYFRRLDHFSIEAVPDPTPAWSAVSYSSLQSRASGTPNVPTVRMSVFSKHMRKQSSLLCVETRSRSTVAMTGTATSSDSCPTRTPSSI